MVSFLEYVHLSQHKPLHISATHFFPMLKLPNSRKKTATFMCYFYVAVTLRTCTSNSVRKMNKTRTDTFNLNLLNVLMIQVYL